MVERDHEPVVAGAARPRRGARAASPRGRARGTAMYSRSGSSPNVALSRRSSAASSVPVQQREHERVAALLLLARLLELDLAVRGGDDVHHRVGPQPQRLGEREHARDVGAALARELAEARPHGGDRDAVGVQHGVDRQALLGPLAADRGGALELGAGRRAQLAQRGQRAGDVAADRPRERLGGQPPEVRDLLADALADPRDEHVELGLDLRDEPADDERPRPAMPADGSIARYAAATPAVTRRGRVGVTQRGGGDEREGGDLDDEQDRRRRARRRTRGCRR